MKIDDLSEDEFISLRAQDGELVECRILGRTIYDEEEYVICSSVSGAYDYIVCDVRAMEGQMVPVSDMIVEEVVDKFLEEHPELKQEDEVIVLTDEDGNEVRFLILDIIEEHDKCYVVCAEDDEFDEVIIMEVKETEGRGEIEEYLSIDDESLLVHLFEVFKERNADYYNFL